MARQRVVDGIDVGRLDSFMDAVKGSPDLGRFQFRARNRWVNGTHCSTSIKDFYGAGQENRSRARPFVLEADEPEVLLGEDHGPNATEALLYALASCLNTTFMYYAAARGIEVEQLEIDMEGDIDLRGLLGLSDQVRSGYQSIRATFRVRADATKEQIEELCQLAQKHSPVFNSVTKGVPVSAQLAEAERAGLRQRKAA